jgi:hypothetical protein
VGLAKSGNTTTWNTTVNTAKKNKLACELAVINQENDDYKNRSFGEKQFEAERKTEEARRKKFIAENLVLPRKLYNNSTAMGRFVLSCALFGFGRGKERAVVKVTLPTFGNGRVHYEGPELRQDDLAVLEGLIAMTRETVLLTTPLKLHPGQFCKSIGWSNSSNDKTKLQDSIERMRKSDLRIVIDSKTGGLFHLVGDFEWDVDCWMVHLSPTIRRLFEGGQTFLPLSDRQLLTDGLQTWLAGFLRAWRNVGRFGTEDLLKYSGSKSSLKEFGRELKGTLQKLKDVGIIADFEAGRGWVAVTH